MSNGVILCKMFTSTIDFAQPNQSIIKKNDYLSIIKYYCEKLLILLILVIVISQLWKVILGLFQLIDFSIKSDKLYSFVLPQMCYIKFIKQI